MGCLTTFVVTKLHVSEPTTAIYQIVDYSMKKISHKQWPLGGETAYSQFHKPYEKNIARWAVSALV